MHSLQQFLSSHNLHHYYDAFIQTGATDHDLPQFLHFTDDELTELIKAVDMLPFHAIKLKSGLRELRCKETEIDASHQDIDSSSESLSDVANGASISRIFVANSSASRSTVLSHAIIYGKNKTRALSSYEKAINQASMELALDDPTLLMQKGQLFEQAKKKLLAQGYQYKRGRSRSKLTSSEPYVGIRKQSKRVTREECATHRSDSRRCIIIGLENDLHIVTLKIKHKEEQQCQSPNAENKDAREYELQTLKEQKSALVRKIGNLKAQERKHQWYKRRKAENSDNSVSDGDDWSCRSSPQEGASQENCPDDIQRSFRGEHMPQPGQRLPIFTFRSPNSSSSDSDDRGAVQQWAAARESDVRGHSMTLYHRHALND